ncbi:MAG: HAD family hydrolase, partial [Balneolales bacterium]|nr:HAD family hydrolase [Balneolales bacterium]
MGFQVYFRPHLAEFIFKCAQVFELAIWSSGTDHYVEVMVDALPAHRSLFRFVWGRSRCTYKRERTQARLGELLPDHEFTKQLKKVVRAGYRKERILIVEDSPLKVLNCYGNAVYVPPFMGQPDNVLPELYAYLLTLKDAPDVRRIEKRFWR